MKVSLLINSKIVLVGLVLLSISSLTAIAQTSNNPITVTTDKSTYADGSTIMISGTVTDQLNIPISIVIRDSSQNPVYLSQVNPNPDNTYSTQATAGGDLWKAPGTYEIDVTYGGKDRTTKTTFEFTGTVPTSTEPQTNATGAIPEFGSLAASVFAISILIRSGARTSFANRDESPYFKTSGNSHCLGFLFCFFDGLIPCLVLKFLWLINRKGQL